MEHIATAQTTCTVVTQHPFCSGIWLPEARPAPHIFAYMQCYVLSLCMQRHPHRHREVETKAKREKEKKKDPNRFRRDIKPLPVGGGWMRARNSTSIKHIQLRNNTHTPNKSEKALGRNKQCLEGKRQRRAVSLPHSEILTLPLFPVWSPKSIFVCRTTFFARDEQKSRKTTSKQKSSSKQASTLLIQHPTQWITARHITHTLLLSLCLSSVVYLFSVLVPRLTTMTIATNQRTRKTPRGLIGLRFTDCNTGKAVPPLSCHRKWGQNTEYN